MTPEMQALVDRIDRLHAAWKDPAVKGRDGRFHRLAKELIENWPTLKAGLTSSAKEAR